MKGVYLLSLFTSFMVGTHALRGGRGKTKQIFVLGDSFCDGGNQGDTPFGGLMGLERKKLLELYQAQINPGPGGELNQTDALLDFYGSDFAVKPFTENQFASGPGSWPMQLEDSFDVEVVNLCVGAARVRQDFAVPNVCEYIQLEYGPSLGLAATPEKCTIEVPGLESQVAMLEGMINAGDVQVKKGSLCTFFFAGNDYKDLPQEIEQLGIDQATEVFFQEYKKALENAKAKCEALGMEVLIGNTFSTVLSPFTLATYNDEASLALFKNLSTSLNQYLEEWFPGQIIDYDQALVHAENIAMKKGKITDTACHDFKACRTSNFCLESCIGHPMTDGFTPSESSALDINALKQYMWLDPIHPTGEVQTDILNHLVRNAFKGKRLRPLKK